MPLQVLALSGAEFFFQYRDSLGALYVVACPRTGCTNAPRQLAAGRASHLLATDDDVYWDDGTNIMRCAREGCPAPSSRNLQVIARSATQDASELTSFCIVGDFIYVVGQGGVARLERKLESDPDWIYVSNAPVKGIAAHGDWVYFAISTLTGEVRRCPITGCVGDPEVVTSGQRWPSWLAVDERSLYWFNFHPEPGNTPAVSLRSATLGDSAEPRILVSNVPLLNYIPIFMNAHHFYWAERLEVRARIRSLAK
jgi:hypothetical protein